jgi:hypothetical protein
MLIGVAEHAWTIGASRVAKSGERSIIAAAGLAIYRILTREQDGNLPELAVSAVRGRPAAPF